MHPFLLFIPFLSSDGEQDACPGTIGSHGRILFEQFKLNLFDVGEISKQTVENASACMFEEEGGVCHLFLDTVEHFGIVECSCQLVGFQGLGKVRFDFQVDGKDRTYGSFLRVYTVTGIETDVFE